MNAYVAGMFLGVATWNGISALEHSNDAIRADAQAQVYERVEMPSEVHRMQIEAGNKEDSRDQDLLVAGLSLIATAAFAGTAVVGGVSRRRYDQ